MDYIDYFISGKLATAQHRIKAECRLHESKEPY